MHFLLKNLGHKIAEERKRRGLTQKEVGKGIGTSGAYISQLENGEREPSLKNYLSLISFFGLDINYFLDIDIDEKEVIGREIQNLRKKRGMDIGELRDKTNVDFFRIGRAENGEIELTEEELKKIADCLEVDVHHFYSRYDYHISKIVNSSKALGLSDEQVELQLKYLDDCIQVNKKHP